MLDAQKLKQDAHFILDVYDHPALHNVAQTMLAIINNPSLVVPAGYSLVRKPELLNKGVPNRG